jgi:hypothetical protein
MPSALDSPGPTAHRHGFILVNETLCHGIGPAEWDDAKPFVLYGSHAEAEAERVDFAEMRAEAEEEAGMDSENADDGPWVEAAVLRPDGTLTLLDLMLTFTMDGLRGFLR